MKFSSTSLLILQALVMRIKVHASWDGSSIWDDGLYDGSHGQHYEISSLEHAWDDGIYDHSYDHLPGYSDHSDYAYSSDYSPSYDLYSPIQSDSSVDLPSPLELPALIDLPILDESPHDSSSGSASDQSEPPPPPPPPLEIDYSSDSSSSSSDSSSYDVHPPPPPPPPASGPLPVHLPPEEHSYESGSSSDWSHYDSSSSDNSDYSSSYDYSSENPFPFEPKPPPPPPLPPQPVGGTVSTGGTRVSGGFIGNAPRSYPGGFYGGYRFPGNYYGNIGYSPRNGGFGYYGGYGNAGASANSPRISEPVPVNGSLYGNPWPVGSGYGNSYPFYSRQFPYYMSRRRRPYYSGALEYYSRLYTLSRQLPRLPGLLSRLLYSLKSLTPRVLPIGTMPLVSTYLPSLAIPLSTTSRVVPVSLSSLSIPPSPRVVPVSVGPLASPLSPRALPVSTRPYPVAPRSYPISTTRVSVATRMMPMGISSLPISTRLTVPLDLPRPLYQMSATNAPRALPILQRPYPISYPIYPRSYPIFQGSTSLNARDQNSYPMPFPISPLPITNLPTAPPSSASLLQILNQLFSGNLASAQVFSLPVSSVQMPTGSGTTLAQTIGGLLSAALPNNIPVLQATATQTGTFSPRNLGFPGSQQTAVAASVPNNIAVAPGSTGTLSQSNLGFPGLQQRAIVSSVPTNIAAAPKSTPQSAAIPASSAQITVLSPSLLAQILGSPGLVPASNIANLLGGSQPGIQTAVRPASMPTNIPIANGR